MKLAVIESAKNSKSFQIAQYRIESDGSLAKMATLPTVAAASFVVFGERNARLYIASETSGRPGTVTTIDPEAGRIVEPVLETAGEASVHLALDRSQSFLAVANYLGDGSRDQSALALLSLGAQGALQRREQGLEHRGSGPDRKRQRGPHCHGVAFSPDNRLLAAADLGIDRVLLYRFDRMNARLEAASEIEMPPGSGPRHIAFHPTGNRLYVTCELSAELAVIDYDPTTGAGRQVGRIEAEPQAYDGRNYPSGLVVSPDGRFLYVANRGPDQIAQFALSPTDGWPHPVGSVPSGGGYPRSIKLDPSGRLLAVAHQRSGGLRLFSRDFATGHLTLIENARFEGAKAMDMAFL
ncbi:lactonase family protein [Rhizobium alvei]|uniref:Lactonase family protein n=1 Tax=Rhizobium alvei TaxID=1132659 RepID=A0ABT8YN26_9HYPH|nr:lactonase family protein [Rhizobium alvei]MDO6965135.1 lactonase family protein [Rhizobium alvei]